MSEAISPHLRYVTLGSAIEVKTNDGDLIAGLVVEVSPTALVLRDNSGGIHVIAPEVIVRSRVIPSSAAVPPSARPTPTVQQPAGTASTVGAGVVRGPISGESPAYNPAQAATIRPKEKARAGTLHIFEYDLSNPHEPQIELKEPQFLVDGVMDDDRNEVIRLKNRFHYAQKMKELQRVQADAPVAARIGRRLGVPAMVRTAGQLAWMAGDVSAAKCYLAEAALKGDLDALIILAVATSTFGDSEVAAGALTYRCRRLGPEVTAADVDVAQCFTAKVADTRRQAEISAVLSVGGSSSGTADTFDSDYRQRLSEIMSAAGGPEVPGRSAPAPQAGQVVTFNRRRDSGQVYQLPSGPHYILFGNDVTDDALRADLRSGNYRQFVRFVPTVDEVRRGVLRAASVSLDASRTAKPSAGISLGAPRVAVLANSGTSYQRATRANHSGDLTTARGLYQREIEARGPKWKSAVKDLMMLDLREGDHAAVRHLAATYRSHFGQDESAPLDQILLQNAIKAQSYQEAREIIEQLKSRVSKRQFVTLLHQDAYCLASLGRFDEAMRVLDGLLKKDPSDRVTAAILEKIRAVSELSVETRSAELQNEVENYVLIGGLSNAAHYYLVHCEFIGVDERSRQQDAYGEKDFRAVTKLLDNTRGKRPKEKSDYHLTLAAILFRNPEADPQGNISTHMSRYFSFRVEHGLFEFVPADTIRFLAAEALYHATPRESNREIGQILRTYISASSDDESVTNDRALRLIESEVLAGGSNPVLRHIPYYCHRSTSFKQYLERNLSLPQEDLSRLLGTADEVSRGQKLEEALSEMRRGALTEHKARSISEVAASLEPMVVFDLDRERLGTFARLAADSALFIGEREYRSKQIAFGRVSTGLDRLLGELLDRPTSLSLESLRDVVKWIREQVQTIYDTFIRDTKAVISVVDVLRDDHYSLVNGVVVLALQVVSEAKGAPVSGVEVEVRVGPGQAPVRVAVPGEVDPGTTREVRVEIMPSEQQIADEVFTVDVSVGYTTDESTEAVEAGPFQIAVRLKHGAPFVRIENPYRQYSGGTVVEETSMFFGRSELLADIQSQVCDGPLGQCFVLYGQKRSGKSSVLQQVRSRVDPRHLLVSFSIGEIPTSNAEAAFARRLIEEIDAQLAERGLPVYSSEQRRLDDREPSEVIRSSLRFARDEVQRIADGGRVILMLDEFTYLWEYIREGLVPKEFMRLWKALLESRLFSAVLVGQDSMPAFKQQFPNEFGVTKDVRISYLSREEAESLIDMPVLYEAQSRYRGSAKADILRLTAGSPFYLQIFCDRLIGLANRRCTNFLTGADVEEVLNELTVGSRQLQLDIFDPLITAAGEDVGIASREEFLDLLGEIAHRQSAAVRELGSDIRREVLVQDLLDRGVLNRSIDGTVHIAVGLFEAWLRVNRPVEVRG